MYIPPDRKREATFGQHTHCFPLPILFFLYTILVFVLIHVIVMWILQSAGCQDGFLGLIEGNGAEFLPVRH